MRANSVSDDMDRKFNLRGVSGVCSMEHRNVILGMLFCEIEGLRKNSS